MKTNETIAIIGATGDMGSSIARSLSKNNYRIILMSRDTEKLRALKDGLSTVDAKATIDSNDCVKDVSWEADIILVATLMKQRKKLLKRSGKLPPAKL